MQRTSLIALLSVVALVGVGAAAAPQATLGNDSYVTTQDSTVTATISVTDTDTATLRVGGEVSGYVLNATVTDENGDGTVNVVFDVSNAGTDGTTLSAPGDDSVAVESETTIPDPPLAATSYDIAVFADGEQTDMASLFVEEGESTTESTTVESTTTESTTEASDPTETPTTDSPTTSGSSGGSAPGFGAVAALAAVLGAAAVAVRR